MKHGEEAQQSGQRAAGNQKTEGGYEIPLWERLSSRDLTI
jgi:hypothetical protein